MINSTVENSVGTFITNALPPTPSKWVTNGLFGLMTIVYNSELLHMWYMDYWFLLINQETCTQGYSCGDLAVLRGQKHEPPLLARSPEVR